MAARSASIAIFMLVLLLVAVQSSADHMKFELHGCVFPYGELFVTLKFGVPAQDYNLHVATGSMLTWLQCKVPPTYCERSKCQLWPQQQHKYFYNLRPEKVVPSTDALCVALVHHPGNPRNPKCAYKLNYAAESSYGYLVRDELTLGRYAHHTVAFGCGYHQVGEHAGPSQIDGVLGLGRIESSVTMISQLLHQRVITKDLISHCFRLRGGGFLNMGDNEHLADRIIWVAMSQTMENVYSPVPSATLHFQGSQISEKQMKNVIFDSGSSYTYFDTEAYNRAVKVVKHSLHPLLKEMKNPEWIYAGAQ